MKSFFSNLTTRLTAPVLAGLFLAAEAGLLLFSAAGTEREPGLILALYAAEFLCGFAVIAVNRRGSVLTAVAGALLLTLKAGLGTHPAAAVCLFLFAGGAAAHLVHSRKKNTLLPFALAFAAGLAGTALFRTWAPYAALALGMLLSGLLILSAVRLKHLRWLFLLLLPLQGVLFTDGEKETELLRKYTELHLTTASALPAAPLCELEEGKLSLLQVTGLPGSASFVPWQYLPFAEEPLLLDLTSRHPAGKQLKELAGTFDLISLEFLPPWHPRALKQLFERLWNKTDPEHGVLVFPRQMCALAPPELELYPVPGSRNSRWAAGRKKLETDPEKLDKRLQDHLRRAGDGEFMVPGVLPGLYKKEKQRFQPPPRRSFRSAGEHGLFFWISLTLLWLFLRLVFSRRGPGSLFWAAAENYASAVLIILTACQLTAFSRMDSHLPEWSYLWCLVPAIPFFGKKGYAERFFLLCSLILPWLLVSSGGGAYHWIIVFAAAGITALSAGMTGAKLLREPGASFTMLCPAAVCGVIAGGLLFFLFFSAENIIPVLTAALLLRMTCLLRK